MRFYRGRYQCPACLTLLSEHGIGGKRRCLNDRCQNYRVAIFGLAK